jgi:hypothetical protein
MSRTSMAYVWLGAMRQAAYDIRAIFSRFAPALVPGRLLWTSPKKLIGGLKTDG